MSRAVIVPTAVTAAFLLCATVAFGFAARYRATMTAFDPTLPKASQVQVRQSADLIAKYPRDPRVRYARAAALYDADHDREARTLLEGTLADHDLLAITPSVEASTRALLAAIDDAEGEHDLAKAIAAPICRTKNAAVHDLIGDICK